MAKNKPGSAKSLQLVTQLVEVRPGTTDGDPVDDGDPAHCAQDKLREMLRQDRGGELTAHMEAELKGRRGIPARRIGLLLAEHYGRSGDAVKLRQLLRRTDPWFLNTVLAGLCCGVAELPQPTLELAADAAVVGLQRDLPKLKATACGLVSSLCSRTDTAEAMPYVRAELANADDEVAVMSTCAVGHVARRGGSVKTCLPGLRRNLRRQATAHWSAWSLAQAAAKGSDIAAAIPDLVWLLEQPHPFSDPLRHATSALLNLAKQSAEAAARVRTAVANARFPAQSKLLDRFHASLESLR